MELRGLENTRAVRKAYWARSAASAVAQVRKGRAVLAADDNGSIHAYRGFDKMYRAEACRHLQTIDKQTFTSLARLRNWYAKWLKKIARD